MEEYVVDYEVRTHNAIGKFWRLSDIIKAINEEEARQKFREKHNKDYEFRSALLTLKVNR